MARIHREDTMSRTPDEGAAGPRDPAAVVIGRREAIRRVGLLLGGAGFVGGSGLLAACETVERPPAESYESVGSFSVADVALLDEVADTILPETETPGAKAAAVGPFVALMVTDTYGADDQAVFTAGMRALDQDARSEHGAPFVDLDPAVRLAMVEALDAEQVAYQDTREGGDPQHWFRMMKELTLLGYFTSEIGCKQAQRWVESPGRYDPCAPYTPGEPSWASNR